MQLFQASTTWYWEPCWATSLVPRPLFTMREQLQYSLRGGDCSSGVVNAIVSSSLHTLLVLLRKHLTRPRSTIHARFLFTIAHEPVPNRVSTARPGQGSFIKATAIYEQHVCALPPCTHLYLPVPGQASIAILLRAQRTGATLTSSFSTLLAIPRMAISYINSNKY